MSTSNASFDPGGFYTFHLDSGTVTARGGERVVIASLELLEPLISAAAAGGDLTPLRSFGQKLAESLTQEVDNMNSLTPEEALTQVATLLALYGWGQLEVSRWGDAVALRLEGMPEFDDRRLAGAAFLGGFFTGLTSNDAACVPVGEEHFLLVDPSIADAVWKAARAGSELPQLTAALQRNDQ